MNISYVYVEWSKSENKVQIISKNTLTNGLIRVFWKDEISMLMIFESIQFNYINLSENDTKLLKEMY